jgi:hypothetical protein
MRRLWRLLLILGFAAIPFLLLRQGDEHYSWLSLVLTLGCGALAYHVTKAAPRHPPGRDAVVLVVLLWWFNTLLFFGLLTFGG